MVTVVPVVLVAGAEAMVLTEAQLPELSIRVAVLAVALLAVLVE
jgi:hypothetical protein